MGQAVVADAIDKYKGQPTKQAQFLLNYMNFNVAVDGRMNQEALNAILMIQFCSGIRITGMIDIETLDAIRNYVAAGFTADRIRTCFNEMTYSGSMLAFTQSVNVGSINPITLALIESMLEECGQSKASITSALRTPEDQARAMFNNIARTGANSQRSIYEANGNAVIDIYVSGKAAGKTDAQILADMTARIAATPEGVLSLHVVSQTTYDKKNIIDIGHSSLTDISAFFNTLNEYKERGIISRVLVENGCYHIEIPMPK